VALIIIRIREEIEEIKLYNKNFTLAYEKILGINNRTDPPDDLMTVAFIMRINHADL